MRALRHPRERHETPRHRSGRIGVPRKRPPTMRPQTPVPSGPEKVHHASPASWLDYVINRLHGPIGIPADAAGATCGAHIASPGSPLYVSLAAHPPYVLPVFRHASSTSHPFVTCRAPQGYDSDT